MLRLVSARDIFPGTGQLDSRIAPAFQQLCKEWWWCKARVERWDSLPSIARVASANFCFVCLGELSSTTRAQTCTPCLGRWSFKHWTAREVSMHEFLIVNMLFSFIHWGKASWTCPKAAGWHLLICQKISCWKLHETSSSDPRLILRRNTSSAWWADSWNEHGEKALCTTSCGTTFQLGV